MRHRVHLALAALAAFFVVAVTGAGTADTFTVRLVSQTNSTITLGWDPQPGYGYLFSAGGVLVSRTNDATRTSVKFSKVASGQYDIDVIVKGSNGHYPPAAPPPPPAGTVTQTIANGSTVTNVNGWRAVYDANGDGAEDDPGSIRFLVDGIQLLSETNAPFGDTFANGSIVVADGQHTFVVQAVTDAGATVATNTVTATVSAGSPPPPPPSGYPDASTTGVPAGTTLTPSGGLTITTSGAVVSGLSVNGGIVVRATNVTIKNSLVQGGTYGIEFAPGASGVVQDVEINCGGPGRKGVLGVGNFQMYRLNIHNCEDGVYATNSFTLKDSYIHDLATSSTAHNDGIQTDGASSNTVVEHNRIYGTDTSAVAFCSNTGCPSPMSNVLIQDNLLAGGAWTLYCPQVATSNFRILNNKFSTIFFPKVGGFGPATDCAGEIQSGNVIYETNQPLTLG